MGDWHQESDLHQLALGDARFVCGEEDLQAVCDAGEKVEDAALAVQRIVTSSAIGHSMFKHAYLRVSRVLFVAKVHQRLRDLEHNDFEVGEVDSYKAEMYREVQMLLSIGHKRYDKWHAKVKHFNKDVGIGIEDPNDEWSFRFDSHLKTVAINSGLLQMLPYEELLFTKGVLENVPAHANLPPPLLEKYKVARDAAKDLIGDKFMNLADMIRVLTKASKSLKLLDRSFEVDLAWLSQHGPDMLVANIHTSILANLPSSEKDISMKVVQCDTQFEM